MSYTASTITKSDFPSQSQNLIVELIGEWGPWQRRTVFLIFLCKIPAAWFMACVIFTAPFGQYGEYNCKQPENITNQTHWMDIVHPMDNGKYDFCNVYENQSISLGDQVLSRNSKLNLVSCSAFEHHSIFHSLVTQFDLVCSRTILIAVTQFSHLCGVLFGGIATTYLLETMSPKYVMLMGMITQIICGCITGLMNNFWLHTIFRLISAMCCALMYTAGAIIFSDITGGKYRKSVICLFESFWGIGVIILPFIAYSLPGWSWTMIYYAISLPTIAYIMVWPLIPDSPKWLLAHGRIDAAKDCLLHAIQVNKRMSQLPDNFDSFLLDEESSIRKATIHSPENWTSLWSTKRDIFLMIALHTAWAVDVTNYNGMLLNIRVFGRDYLILNTVICGLSEIAGVLIAWFIVMHNQNRKFLCSGLFNIIAGAFSFLGFLFPESLSSTAYNSLGMTLAMLSVIATTCSQAVLFTCTAESLPLTKQKIAIFSCVVWARIWLLTAPFIGVLTFIHNLFPLAAFGLIELCGGICSCIIDHMQNKFKIKIQSIQNHIVEHQLQQR